MFRNILCSFSRLAIATRTPQSNVFKNTSDNLVKQITVRNFSLLNIQAPLAAPKLLENAPKPQPAATSTRTVTKFSIRKGKRKSVKAVLKRFYRLQWGIWIRTKAGRNKKLWKKNPPQKRRLRQHVFCNSTQSHMLDKMVGPYWRKPRYFIDDPYQPYHVRNEFERSRVTPKPYIPPEDRI
ncbi:unnamed protein product [Phyllotreta striolata]|uniref:Large ribosomal subunit protein bL35m n=1 Tax=Phyllotreta striolata TaxID=444603 RepID=A0A9N9TFR9_PHYSR|nr:unnamed protein product [Phyllotreta striolata]